MLVLGCWKMVPNWDDIETYCTSASYDVASVADWAAATSDVAKWKQIQNCVNLFYLKRLDFCLDHLTSTKLYIVCFKTIRNIVYSFNWNGKSMLWILKFDSFNINIVGSIGYISIALKQLI